MKNSKLKILELTNFSAGVCGVWQRVKQESQELSKLGYDVQIFSSNSVKGSDNVAAEEDCIKEIKIKRFPFKKLGGESFMSWKFEKQAIEFMPDIIIAHSYRHLHTNKALSLADKIRKTKPRKVFLVTHAPFMNIQRNLVSKIIVSIYDSLFSNINKFDKIIAITKWEIPYLLNLGVKREKMAYIPNGIPKEFFKTKRKIGKDSLFLGRISPVKNIETLIMAVKDMNIKLDIVGPAEEDYKKKLLALIKEYNVKNIRFLPAVYDLDKKIKIIDSHEIFVLQSKTESMPQSLIEAMARGKIPISSNTMGGKEIINSKNGFLFDIGNSKQLSQIIRKIQTLSQREKDKIRKEAIKTAEKFKWSLLIKDLERLF